jgi:hypothetical protein
METAYSFDVKGSMSVPIFGSLVLAMSDVRRLDRSRGAPCASPILETGGKIDSRTTVIDFVTVKAPDFNEIQ